MEKSKITHQSSNARKPKPIVKIFLDHTGEHHRVSNCNSANLLTIPGVGRRTAEVIVAALDDPNRFQNARQVSAYAGLVPDQRHNSYGDATRTGQTNRLGKITRRGSELLRSALVEAAWAMLRYNPWAVKIYQRICGGQKTHKKTAIIALARKLLVRCWAMLRRKETWQDDTPWSTATTSLGLTTNPA
jgi:transposase